MDFSKNENVLKSAKSLLEKGAKEVFLFGSFFKDSYTDTSDIDLGVKGFPPSGFFSAIVDLENITQRHIDLVDFDFDTDFFNHLVKTNAVIKIGAA